MRELQKTKKLPVGALMNFKAERKSGRKQKQFPILKECHSCGLSTKGERGHQRNKTQNIMAVENNHVIYSQEKKKKKKKNKANNSKSRAGHKSLG